MERKIPVVRVNQWLESWNLAQWSPEDNLPEPDRCFYVGAMPLILLRELAGVNRRRVEDRRLGSAQSGYQRPHEIRRSTRIARYIQYGFPLSNSAGIDPQNHRDLIHPGWLPTAILVNVLAPGDHRTRSGKMLKLAEKQALHIEESPTGFQVVIPTTRPEDSELEPLEIIDGQHRIFAVDELDGEFARYEVPVVFFRGLSTSWQAYLFWVINVEPRKINPSLAFDLYPELRSQSWLERGEGLKIYQEHRAQEITEALWRHADSPWRSRIELLGSRVEGHVSNAAFIRSLMSTFVRRWGKENRIGGLFGSLSGDGRSYVLPWTRTQQIAFLITCWAELSDATRRTEAEWAVACRRSYRVLDEVTKKRSNPFELDPAFAGPYSLLASDQGVRAVSFVFNSMCQVAYSSIGLDGWESQAVSDEDTTDLEIDAALGSLRGRKSIVGYLRSLARALVADGFDWRTSKEPTLSPDQRLKQSVYRGSSGYSQLQRAVMEFLASSKDATVSDGARSVVALRGQSSE